ncbi:MAG: adenosylmethionine decarboxylase [Bacteroidia bacterium]|nr:adenosylmethionine decarboxylase [Bacteroidia bacterium]
MASEAGPLGIHILAELYGVSPLLLDDEDWISRHMQAAAAAAGATVLGAHFHRFSPQGVTGVVVIQESHLTIHTWPEYGYAAVDIFTCGADIHPWRAYEYLREAMNTDQASAQAYTRGQLPRHHNPVSGPVI